MTDQSFMDVWFFFGGGGGGFWGGGLYFCCCCFLFFLKDRVIIRFYGFWRVEFNKFHLLHSTECHKRLKKKMR